MLSSHKRCHHASTKVGDGVSVVLRGSVKGWNQDPFPAAVILKIIFLFTSMYVYIAHGDLKY